MSTLLLQNAVDILQRHYGPSAAEPPTRDPFELILWENVGYLATRDRRRAAFDLLKSTVGVMPEAILAASDADLERVTAHGILKERFAGKLRDCARIALESCGGDVTAAIEANPRAASKILRKFPGIVAPGADKVLLLSGHGQLLAPESNGLRVLERLGIIAPESSYARSYAAANRAANGAVRDPVAAHLVLHRHGQDLCKLNHPKCGDCPLVELCSYPRADNG